MSSPDRLWIQVMPSCGARASVEALALPAAIAVDLVVSGVGAIIGSAADRLIAADQHVVKTVLAHEAGFVLRAGEATPRLLFGCITLNVGATPIPVRDDRAKTPLPFSTIARSATYRESPVVIRIELDESRDGTAVAARVTHWKYERFLDPSPTPFRNPRRKVTVEVKVADPDGNSLLKTALQVEADAETLNALRPNDGERLPWAKRPVRNFAGERRPGEDQEFGPVNIEASITEVAEPSRFGKLVGSTLSSQKAGVERYVKDRLTQALDEPEAAKARLASLKDATTARAEYDAAHAAASEAARAVAAAPDAPARIAARQALALKLATLRQKELLARAAFDGAGLAFEALPGIEQQP